MFLNCGGPKRGKHPGITNHYMCMQLLKLRGNFFPFQKKNVEDLIGNKKCFRQQFYFTGKQRRMTARRVKLNNNKPPKKFFLKFFFLQKNFYIFFVLFQDIHGPVAFDVSEKKNPSLYHTFFLVFFCYGSNHQVLSSSPSGLLFPTKG